MTRASAYRDALKSFIHGYQEAIQQDLEKKEDFNSEHQSDIIVNEISLTSFVIDNICWGPPAHQLMRQVLDAPLLTF
jgi:hypothetical protein